ncbi:hypothetical protein MSAN_02222700 [Mycena sanguinolenta]|uniref:DUF4604 domain-containing protein n=1 Tax=Mycena sanguinolenta TaxID=230812 RepID=A0A8H7CIS2_9AGAR|nr:hypothetical protein MSAN_02222700 [Mycena sanguinolenta]
MTARGDHPFQDGPRSQSDQRTIPGAQMRTTVTKSRKSLCYKRGKHLTEREAENLRREVRGLPPLPDPDESTSKLPPESETKAKAPAKSKEPAPSLSFSSAKNSFKNGAAKRKAALIGSKADGPSDSHPKKKPKKESKTLLSFGDDP